MSSNNTLELQAGSTAQLQLVHDDAAQRHSVRVIGQIPGVSILVTTPVHNGRVLLVRDGQVFVVRCFTQDRALAFTSRVLKSNTQPYPYLHLSYPEQSEQVTLRNARRVNVLLVGQVQRTGDGAGKQWGPPRAILVSDISATGAMLDSVEPLGTLGDRLRLSLHFPIDRMGEQSAVVEGYVRIIYEEGEGRFRCGVEFVDLQPSQELALRAYVYEQLLGADARPQ